MRTPDKGADETGDRIVQCSDAKQSDASDWWSEPRYLLIVSFLCAVPLIWPSLPPLTDALGHMARYHIELTIDRSPYLHRWYVFHWSLIGNLGADLLVVPLSHIFGVRFATKLIVMTIPVLTAMGLLLTAREIHGRVPPTAVFALPLALSFAFQFGFINYCLSMALAVLAFGLWLRLGRLGRTRFRALLFVPIGLALWICHAFGWAVLGLLVGAAALARATDEDGWRAGALRRTIVAGLPLTPPILLMLLWRSQGVAGGTGFWFHWIIKFLWVIGALRDRWEIFDRSSIAIILFVILAFGATRRPGFVRVGAFGTLALLAAFICLPHVLLGSAYADMRLAPFVLAMALVAIKPPHNEPRLAKGLAVAALAFLVVRIGAATIGLAQVSARYDRQLTALDHIPRGARILALVGVPCNATWDTERMAHLAGQATLRRDAFVNDQWALPGAQLLTVRYPEAGYFAIDPSEVVHPAECRDRGEPSLVQVLAHFPHAAFDYVWLIALAPNAWPRDPKLVPVWHTADGALFRVARPARSPIRSPNG